MGRRPPGARHSVRITPPTLAPWPHASRAASCCKERYPAGPAPAACSTLSRTRRHRAGTRSRGRLLSVSSFVWCTVTTRDESIWWGKPRDRSELRRLALHDRRNKSLTRMTRPSMRILPLQLLLPRARVPVSMACISPYIYYRVCVAPAASFAIHCSTRHTPWQNWPPRPHRLPRAQCAA